MCEILAGRGSADPIVLANCDSALLRVNQWWGSHCHAHLCYCPMSILIFVRVLENYFWSCDENAALADKHEIGRLMGFPMPY